VPHWLTKKDFNSSDCFRHRLWWFTLCLFIWINVAVCLPSKNMGGNDVLHIFFLAWSFLKCWYCPLSSIKPGLCAIGGHIPHAMNMDRFCFIFLCICVWNISSLIMNFFALSNIITLQTISHSCASPLFRHA
jgi:hypothetical protein